MSSDVVLYGLRVRSEIPLHGRSATGTGNPDLEVVLGPAMPPPVGAPPGHVLAHCELNPAQWYTFTRRPADDFVLRFAGICDFVVDAALARVIVHPVAGAESDMISVFAAGALLSFVLVMRGETLLHASAVDIGDQAVAFVGRSGMGKSTLATLCCTAGGRLVTDDVLRLSPGPRPRCYLGPAELRLRNSAAELAESFADRPALRRTGDGRDALQARLARTELLPLAAIVIPLPDRDGVAPVVVRLDGAQALLALLSFPRIVGWQDPVAHAQQFQLLGDVASSVPIYTARVPWGPPFVDNLARDVLDGAGVKAPLVVEAAPQ